MIPDYAPKVILDVGAHDLSQSIEFSIKYPNSRIISFEPNPNWYAVCENRSKEYKNIEVFPLAVSNFKGISTFHIPPSNTGAASLLEPIDVPWGVCEFYKIDVETVILNSFLPSIGVDKVDILWMDIQGAELAALEGYSDYLLSTDFIECEASKIAYYIGHPTCDVLEKYFDDHGFTHSFHLPFEGPPHKYIEGELVCVNQRLMKS